MAHPWHSANHIYLWMTIHCILVLFINVTLSILFLSFYNLQRWHFWCFPCQVTGRNIAIVSLCQPMENKMKVNLKDFIQKYIHMCLSDIKWNLYKKIIIFIWFKSDHYLPLSLTLALTHSLNEETNLANHTYQSKVKNSHILPTGQWYAPSAVINDAWYCMVLHCIA